MLPDYFFSAYIGPNDSHYFFSPLHVARFCPREIRGRDQVAPQVSQDLLLLQTCLVSMWVTKKALMQRQEIK